MVSNLLDLVFFITHRGFNVGNNFELSHHNYNAFLIIHIIRANIFLVLTFLFCFDHICKRKVCTYKNSGSKIIIMFISLQKMHRSLTFCLLVFLLACFPKSSQSPQSSFFGWSSSETVAPRTENQTPLPATSSRPNTEQTHSFVIPVKEPIELVSLKPEISNSSQTVSRSWIFNTLYILLAFVFF